MAQKRTKHATRKPAPRKVSPRISYTKKSLGKALQKQEKKLAEKIAWRKAEQAVSHYRAKAKDRKQFVFINSAGKANPQLKGKPGYLVYVTGTGKKKLVTKKGKAPELEKISSLKLPQGRNRRKASKEFYSKRVLVREGRTYSRGKGKVEISGRRKNLGFGRKDETVKAMADSLAKAFKSQKSHRMFIITANVLVRLPNGKKVSFSFSVPIDKPDHISIDRGGLENFVRQKVYAFMAKELAYHGLVTAGSANHIRKLAGNKGMPKEYLSDKSGGRWHGADMDICKIVALEWRIEQAE